MSKKRLAIIGAGIFGQQIAFYAATDNLFDVVGFFDDTIEKGNLINNFPVLGNIDSIEEAYDSKIFDEALIGIGYGHMEFRKELFLRLRGKISFAILIHSKAIVASNAVLEEGVIIYPGCVIDANVLIKANVSININSMIAHDSIINSHTFISACVSVAGYCEIGELNILGISSVTIDNIKTVASVELGGGAVVVKNINKQGIYAGVPARFLR